MPPPGVPGIIIDLGVFSFLPLPSPLPSPLALALGVLASPFSFFFSSSAPSAVSAAALALAPSVVSAFLSSASAFSLSFFSSFFFSALSAASAFSSSVFSFFAPGAGMASRGKVFDRPSLVKSSGLHAALSLALPPAAAFIIDDCARAMLPSRLCSRALTTSQTFSASASAAKASPTLTLLYSLVNCSTFSGLRKLTKKKPRLPSLLVSLGR
mmetsp:Transcript_70134/g.180794  ORF Transcript_70134/g.180794 Transcript_70134/m.180794 type:complete len:212 (-) Transcript_70134:983-1618(-)